MAFHTASGAKAIIFHIGDSISASGNPWCWPYQVYNLSSHGDGGSAAIQKSCTYYVDDVIMRNMAVAGTRLNRNGYPDAVPLCAADVFPIMPMQSLYYQGGSTQGIRRKKIFGCAIGSNDGATDGGTPATYAASVGAFMLDAKNTGKADITYLCTLLPRTDGVMTEPNRTGYNSIIKGGTFMSTWSIDYVIDVASDSIIGDPANCSNATWYDQATLTGLAGVHPTTAGHARLCTIANTTIQAILASI